MNLIVETRFISPDSSKDESGVIDFAYLWVNYLSEQIHIDVEYILQIKDRKFKRVWTFYPPFMISKYPAVASEPYFYVSEQTNEQGDLTELVTNIFNDLNQGQNNGPTAEEVADLVEVPTVAQVAQLLQDQISIPSLEELTQTTINQLPQPSLSYIAKEAAKLTTQPTAEDVVKEAAKSAPSVTPDDVLNGIIEAHGEVLAPDPDSIIEGVSEVLAPVMAERLNMIQLGHDLVEWAKQQILPKIDGFISAAHTEALRKSIVTAISKQLNLSEEEITVLINS